MLPKELSLKAPLSRSLSKSAPRDPSSKPPPPKPQITRRAEDDISVQPLTQVDDQCVGQTEEAGSLPVVDYLGKEIRPKSKYEDLPTEVLEVILNHVVCPMGSTNSQTSTRNWNAIMRHPRRKNVGDLALVSNVWRQLIQERIYRHIKVQGTRNDLTECGDFFLTHKHLQHHVRHFQVLVPIWEQRKGVGNMRATTADIPSSSQHNLLLGFQFNLNNTLGEANSEVSQLFQLASQNATMAEIFGCAQVLFPDLYALTIEGGHCKHPPQVKYFLDPEPEPESEPESSLPRAPTPQPPGSCSTCTLPIKTDSTTNLPPTLPVLQTTNILILKGAWNIIRQSSDFTTLTAALPSLREFHATYHAPKTNAYTTMCEVLQSRAFPRTMAHLNLCLEGLYTKNASSLEKWKKVYPAHHICRDLGARASQLESLTYTGRVCGALFSTAIRSAEKSRGGCTRLKSIDIVVSNVCRDASAYSDLTGINLPFLQAFELLILQAVRSLSFYTSVVRMRIRFIDLDSPAPLLNPSFHLEGNKAWGIFSEEIVASLRDSRPNVVFEGMHIARGPGEEQRWSGRRSTSVEYYRAMAQGLGRGLA